jgi:hypothetical protein
MKTPHYASPAGTGADSLLSALADAARRVRRSATGLTRADREFCRDVARAKYPARWLARLAKLAARCTRDDDRHALDEALHGYVVVERGFVVPMGVSESEADEQETLAQGRFDVAQLLYARSPTPANRDALIEAATAQIAATRRRLDAAHAAALTRPPLSLVR